MRRSSAPLPPVRDIHPSRPFGVTIVGALFTLGAFASFLSSVSLLTPGGPLEPMWWLNPRAHAGFVTLQFWAPILLGGLMLVCGAAAFGFFWVELGVSLGIALLIVNSSGT